ncbi:MAG TPA: helix-turn-helix domain-containing protein, partial [bacterium (Candidatus Stahlbacteria)]|nr:helix-turn-helix domain-containing protein [Candidatus Stahlbacteria bacterium]
MHTFKPQVVTEYLKGGISMRQLAKKYGIHFSTVYRWMNHYRCGRFQLEIEKINQEIKVVWLKESEPSLSLLDAWRRLKSVGNSIPIKRIWSIWRKYGYLGFDKDYISNVFIKYVVMPKRYSRSLKILTAQKNQLSKEELKNIIKFFPLVTEPEILFHLDDTQLAPTHRLCKLLFSPNRLPLKTFVRKANRLRKLLLKSNFQYSFLRANYVYIFGLDWLGDYEKAYKAILETEERYSGITDLGLKFSFYLCKARSCMALLKFKDAMASFRTCQDLLRQRKRLVTALTVDLAVFATKFGYYRIAEKYLKLSEQDSRISQLRSYHMARCALEIAQRNYTQAIRSLRATKDIWGYRSRYYYIMALRSLSFGRPAESIERALLALDLTEKEGILGTLGNVITLIAGVKIVTGNIGEGMSLLNNYLPLFRRKGLKLTALVCNLLLTRDQSVIPKSAPPIFRLLEILLKGEKRKSYRHYLRAYHFAQTELMAGLFLNYLLYFPDYLKFLYEKRLQLLLPRNFIQLPIFKEHPPTYELRFLGPVSLKKGAGSFKRLRIRPKELSFLTFLFAQKTMTVRISQTLRLFWPHRSE